MRKYQKKSGETIIILLITAAVVLSSVSIQATTTFPQTDNTVIMTYSFTKPVMSKIVLDHSIYDQIFIQGAPCSGNPGEPFLPTKGANLLLPPNTKVENITVTGEKTSLGIGFTILPCGKSIPLVPNARDVEPIPNEAVYTSHALFPDGLFSEVGVYQFRGYSILVLMLYPVQYIPDTGEIFYYSTLNVTITVTNDPRNNSLFRGFQQDRNELFTKIENPTLESTYDTTLPAKIISNQYDLLILTTDELKNGFEPLASQHNATGTRTIIRTLSDVGGCTPEDIRAYLQTAYTTLGIRYILLGGDADVVPAKMLWVEGMDENVTPYETDMPADLYYACLDGTYNYDGDDKWGEPTDGDNGGDVDLIADVYVGRACVDTLDEVSNFVQKTVEYLSLKPGETYLGDVTLAGEYLGDYGIASYGGTYLDQLINGSTDDGYTTVGIPAEYYRINKVYDSPGYSWPASTLISLINNGVYIINHLGHASYEYNMRMTTGDVNGLTNTHNFCFVYSQGCMSGGFDNPEGGDCIAEYFTVKNTHGAFAGIWNARYGFFWSYSTDGDSQRLDRQFWDAVFGEHIREIGRANHDSKEDNLFLIQRSCIRWCYYETNLFGDPAVTFLNGSGQQPHIRITEVKGGNGFIHASVLNEGQEPVTNIPWSITIYGGLLRFVNITTIDSLVILTAQAITSIHQDKTLFGLGKITIQVTVKYAEEWNGKGFLLGPFVLRVIQNT
jgi:hypothetical protein